MESDDAYNPEETRRRMERAVRLALNTPPKPHKEIVGKRKRAKAKKRGRVTPSHRSKPK